jgi:hypothetical protein
VKLLLVVYLLILVPVVAALVMARRRNQSSEGRLRAAEAHELEASRALIDRLLTTAVDHRDVDAVLAPIVIDEIRTHQRQLQQRREPPS